MKKEGRDFTEQTLGVGAGKANPVSAKEHQDQGKKPAVEGRKTGWPRVDDELGEEEKPGE